MPFPGNPTVSLYTGEYLSRGAAFVLQPCDSYRSRAATGAAAAAAAASGSITLPLPLSRCQGVASVQPVTHSASFIYLFIYYVSGWNIVHGFCRRLVATTLTAFVLTVDVNTWVFRRKSEHFSFFNFLPLTTVAWTVREVISNENPASCLP